MIVTSSRARGIAIAILMAGPIASLFINAFSWLHYGIDLPFYDDIRPYLTRSATSLDPKVLFIPANDTLYPVGMALDALAQRTLSGNAIAYQLISMMVLLSGLLWMQWRLLTTALQDRLHAAVAFSVTLLMLWPGSYWGLQSLAYHHGLPMLFLMGALTILLTTAWPAWMAAPAVFLLGLLAGFSYISGAFATLAAGIVLVILSIYLRAIIPALRSGAPALLTAGFIAVASQLWVILAHQQGRIHDPSAPWTWPTEAGFWMFILGKIGRGLALPIESPVLSLSVVLAVVALTILLVYVLSDRIFRERSATPVQFARTATVFLTLAAIMGAYLPVLAAGRAYLEAPEPRTLMAMFIHGLPEFYHSFWVTVFLPWAAAAALVCWRQVNLAAAGPRMYVAPIAAAALVYAASSSGGFEHARFYKTNMEWRMRGDVACVRKALDTGRVDCPERYDEGQLLGVLAYARQIGASFVRYFPLKPIPLGTDSPAPLYRLSEDANLATTIGQSPARVAEGVAFPGVIDPMLMLNLPRGTLSACWELEVTMDVKAEDNEISELFTLVPGQPDFMAPSSSLAIVRKGAFTAVTLRAYSLDGFQDRLRIDPVVGQISYIIRDLEVRCRTNVDRPAA